MKRTQLHFGEGFRIAITTDRSQAAVMVVPVGDKEGGPDNRHRGADQWLYVVAGTGMAIVNAKRYKLQPGSLLAIEAGDLHEIPNTGSESLQTLNFYVPPAYRASGTELLRGKK
jgi:mannose-6-phosphate isomerase-like protein (cupin superfamily)